MCVPTRQASPHLLTGLLLAEGVEVMVTGPRFPPARLAFALPEVGSPPGDGSFGFMACGIDLPLSSGRYSRAGAAGPRFLAAMSMKGAIPFGTLAGEGVSL